jgi:6,7-dimethyl-8-ribityllumazine synthase
MRPTWPAPGERRIRPDGASLTGDTVSGEGRPAAETVDAAGLTLAIAVTRWHAEITDALTDRALAAAKACCVNDPLVVRVPGAVELPVVAAELARSHDAVACLGAVIRGGTPHFEYVCDAVTYGITRVALDAGKPVGNGVLTCDTLEQACDRSGQDGSREDKGWEAVVAALETALVLRSLRGSSGGKPSAGGTTTGGHGTGGHDTGGGDHQRH